ncbi:MAG: glycosyltransferase family 4 protein, partial [Clostridiales bacterium]|nr:glycosyltransferase family 4 protein [Clostridiales bacterium]
MRIVYLHQYFSTPEGSSGIRSYEMARRMVQAGHEVFMITSERSGKFSTKKKWYQTEEAGIKVYWTPVLYSNHMGYLQRIQAFFQYAWRAAWKAASFDADIIFATSTPLTIALPAVYASKKNKIPLVFEVRDLWPELPIAIGAIKNPLLIAVARWLERFAYRNSARVIALSPGMKAGVIKSGYPENKVSVIPNSCDLDLFDVDPNDGNFLRKQYNWLQDRPLVVYI